MTSGLADRHPLKEKRRANKPLLERKRRARINDSLTDLKHLVLSSLNKDVSKYTKMEKVDILDMTVRYLKGRSLDKRQEDCSTMYRAGYRECTKEMYQNIMTMDGLDHSVKCRILSNLANNQREDNKLSPPPSPTMSNESLSPLPVSSPPSPLKMLDPMTRHYASNHSRVFVPQFTSLPPLVRKNPPTNSVGTPSLHQLPPVLESHHLSKDMTRLPSKPMSPVWRPW